MDDAVRLQYLTAMGVDVWVSRHSPVAIVQVAEESSEHVGWADDCMDATTEGWSGNRARAMPGAIAGCNDAHHDSLGISENIATPETPERWAALSLVQPTGHAHDDTAWKQLQHEVSICRACSLCETRTQTVFGVGSKQADWLLIGEAPGQNEDLQGEPFVGRAGQLLNEMLRAISLQRQQVYIANVLKCRPPNNRDPQAEEVDACNAFLQQQIGLIRPKIILAVGRIAAQNLLHTQQPLSRLRGTCHHYNGIPMIVLHHPAYLLRSLTEKAKAWEDLQFALSIYQSLQ